MNRQEKLVFRAIEQLQTLSHLFMKKRSELANRVGLTEAQWRVMEEIDQKDFMPSMFAAKREYSKAAVSKILRQLLEKDMVSFVGGEMDGRTKKYSLTNEGRLCLKSLNKIRLKAVEEVWMTLEPDLLEASISFNEQLIRNLRQNPQT